MSQPPDIVDSLCFLASSTSHTSSLQHLEARRRKPHHALANAATKADILKDQPSLLTAILGLLRTGFTLMRPSSTQPAHPSPHSSANCDPTTHGAKSDHRTKSSRHRSLSKPRAADDPSHVRHRPRHWRPTHADPHDAETHYAWRPQSARAPACTSCARAGWRGRPGGSRGTASARIRSSGPPRGC